ncbi:General secretion pathway protein-related protein, ATPase [gamma proteobacterium HdN1]|nr:General secretion pathway protein-related protein, ATPase [gamma proteobacterium HdN1]
MYQEFFGLKEAPFSIAPNPHYLYMSKQHHEALAHLIYGVGRDGGFVLLTGEVGTGKTTICRCFLEQVPKDTDVAFILNPKLNAQQLLATICDELGISYIDDEISIKELVDYINQYLLESHANGRHTVLIIDEAQNLSPEVLEQLRLLTNLETYEKKLLQIVLLGQPELQDMFLRPDLRQLAQRVTARFHLKELESAELGPYVRHRLGVAGGKDITNIFPEKTLKKLYAITSGVPRVINLVCDRAMLGAYAQSQRSIDINTLENAAREILGPSFAAKFHKPSKFARYSPAAIFSPATVVGGAFILVCLGMLIWLVHSVNVSIDVATRSAATQAMVGNLDRNAAELQVVQATEPQGVASKHDKATDKRTDAIPSSSENPATSNEPDSSDKMSETAEPSATAPELATSSEPASLLEPSAEPSAEPFVAQGEYGEEAAYSALLSLWQISTPKAPHSATEACEMVQHNKFQCLTRSGSLGLLRHLGLPAVVTLYNGEGRRRFVVVRSMDSSAAGDARVLLQAGATQYEVSEDAFNRAWRGQFTLFWQVPASYRAPLMPGVISPLVPWLRNGLSQLDLDVSEVAGQASGSLYDPALVERVKAFQRKQGEPADGIVGEMTLILLTRELDAHLPKLVREG